MRCLNALLAILGARWFWTLVGASLLSIIVLLFGDLLKVGDDDRQLLPSLDSRLICVLIIAVLWGLSNLWRQEWSRRNNARLVEALAPPPAPNPGNAEVDELGRRFQTVLTRLRRDRMGEFGRKQWLYQLPWYVMIGPPASGKTTALVESGLRFPMSGAPDLRGVGGTRYCDWLFTDQAVLIDTAGRYTSQDSDAVADRAAWEGFLDLLRRHRPRQPLNGVLAAIPATVLTGARGQAEREAARIRARMQEIEQRLKMRMPVYLLITKVDLIAGFSAFFETLEERDREQVWGHTFPGAPGQPATPDQGAVRVAMDDLIARLDTRMSRRLAEENDLARRGEIFAFPPQIAALGAGISRFAEQCFAPAGYEPGIWLRGIYLSSGTQTGSPIDRLMDAISESLGLAAAPARQVMGDRSFFLTRLLRDVVFAEASLVGRDPAAERRERLLRFGAFAGVAAATLLLCWGWTWSYVRNDALQLSFATRLAAISDQLRQFGQTQLTPGEGDDLPMLPVLGSLIALRNEMASSAPLTERLGLSRRGAMRDLADAAYHNALADALLPRLALSVEAGLRRHISDPVYVLDALKVYLMVGNQALYVPGPVADWFARDADERAGADAGTAIRGHVIALSDALTTVTQWPSQDAKLVEAAKATLERLPLPRRAYAALLAIPELNALPGWRLTDHAGATATIALTRKSGAKLNDPIPAIFTYDGFHKAVLPLVDTQARTTWNEAWMIGSRGTPQPAPGELDDLKAGILELYYEDFQAKWDALLGDVVIAPLGGDITHGEQVSRALAAPTSPLKLFLKAAVQEVDLAAQPPGNPPPADMADAAKAAGARLTGWLKRTVGSLAPSARASTSSEPPGASVSAHFAPWKAALTGTEGGPPPIDDVGAAFAAYHAAVAPLVVAPGAPDVPPKMMAAGIALRQAVGGAAGPLKDVVGESAQGAGPRGAVRQQLTNAWRAQGLELCLAAVSGRFPFVPGSQTDASLEDLAQVFGKGGLIDGFVTTSLAPYVDTARKPWGDTQNLGLNRHALAMFQLARDIGRKLMGVGSAPRATFTLTLDGMEGGAAGVEIDLDGGKQSFDTGPRIPRPFLWPGPAGTGVVRVTFSSASGIPATDSREGPWAFFRMATPMAAGQIDRFSATMHAGQYGARFTLKANSTENPFDLRVFSRFSCPDSL